MKSETLAIGFFVLKFSVEVKKEDDFNGKDNG